MGLSFHYRGKIKLAASLPPMIEEIIDIAKINDWEYFVLDSEFPNNKLTEKPDKENLYGICITPPGCEAVCFSFLSNGKLCDILSWVRNKDLENLEDEEHLYYVSAKTQYAGLEIHKKIILLFDYLNIKYFEDLYLNDEGEYWETRDDELLKKIFERYTNLIESFESVLENIPINESEKTEDYLLRMAEIVEKNNENEQ
jgi:hypothetical protein